MSAIYAGHIRGRVQVRRDMRPVRPSGWITFTVNAHRITPSRRTRTYYTVTVFNSATGLEIASDDHFGTLSEAIAECSRDVAAARRAWSLGWRRSDLKAKP